MELHLKIIGWLFVALALIHAVFPSYFNWKKELVSLSLINRQLMYVHSFFIAFVVLLMGVLCITSAHEITTTHLGRTLSLGLAIFWGVRLLFQFFGYSSQVWKGKVFETIVHIAFSFLWLYVTIIFALTYISN
ncbi:MAG: hypothetical protein K9J17_02250 [Flavobacteriales bacterium]|nr:hypothetical protein [Flavobacteriales bacterium]